MAKKNKKTDLTDQIYRMLVSSPYTYQDLSDGIGESKQKLRHKLKAMKTQGYPIQERIMEGDTGRKEFYINRYDTGGHIHLEKNISHIGVVSDTHLGSETELLDELNQFYDEIRDRGIDTVLHCGDMISGEGVYRGQQFENTVHGISNQCDHVIEDYPEFDGVTYFITGNHDLKQFEKAGIETGDLIMAKADKAGRDDLSYVGRYRGRIVFDDMGHTIDIHHYMKGASAYTQSYRSQMHQRDEPPNKRADIQLLGHKHVTMYMHYNEQHFFEAGCFQGQTDYLHSKGINSTPAGWILEIETDERGIVRVIPELLVYDA